MAINVRLLKCLILIILFLFGLSVLQAQTAGYFLDPNSAEPRFIQRLAWSGGAYSLYYEVIIEKERGGLFESHIRESTAENFIEISLPPGNYRFRVIPYDILNRPSAGTQWAAFKVFSAVKPVLYQPKEEIAYVNDGRKFIFAFDGENLAPDAESYFVNPEGERVVPVEVINNDDGSNISFVFDKDQLIDGEYEVFVINPGGLEESLRGIKFKSPPTNRLKSIVFIYGVSLMPIYPLYGDNLSSTWTFFNMAAWISISSYVVTNTYLGMELLFSKCMYDTIYGQSGLSAGYNLLLIKWTPSQKAAYNFKMGLSYAPALNSTYLNMGVSALFRLTRYLNVESGINYSHSLDDNTRGGFLPWVGMSMLF